MVRIECLRCLDYSWQETENGQLLKKKVIFMKFYWEMIKYYLIMGFGGWYSRYGSLCFNNFPS